MSARENAVSFEAIKVAMRQTKDGYAMTLVIHPNDVPPDLFATPVGQRYGVALVALGDNEEPLPPQPRLERGKDAGSEAVAYAGALCREPLFWDFLNQHIDYGVPFIDTEAEAATQLRRYIGVESRAEMATNDKALYRFRELNEAYHKWAGI